MPNHAVFGGSISRLLDMCVETGPGNRSGNYFTLAEFKAVYLTVYPEDSHLFPKGEVKGAFRDAVAAHLGVAVASIAYNRRVGSASADSMVPASYAVCGFGLRASVQELAEAEATMVKPDRIMQDLLDADPTKPLPSRLRRRVQCRWACSHRGSDELGNVLRGRWHAELSQQLDDTTGDGDLSDALRDRLKLGDGWALKLAMGETTASSPMSPSLHLRANNIGWDNPLSWEEDLTNAMLARDGFPGHDGQHPRSRLRVAARNYARRQARAYISSEGGEGSEGGGGSGGSEGDGSNEGGGSGEADEIDTSSSCTICLETMEGGVLVKLIGNTERDAEYPCRHEFHGQCIEEWLKRSPTCPTCRAHPRSQQYFLVGCSGERSLIKDIKVPKGPKQADIAHPDGINGARNASDNVITPYHSAVLRTFRQLISGSNPNAALAGMEEGSASQGRQLRSRSRS